MLNTYIIVSKEIIMSDTLEAIHCPACGRKMEKLFIESANCNVDICIDGCGGIFFDNREFKKFDEQHENIDEILNAYKNNNYVKVNEDIPRTCPVCEKTMAKHFASSKHEVEIDECYSCGGIFLDFGELEKIRSQFKTEKERQGDFIKILESSPEVRAELEKNNFIDYKQKNYNEMFGEKRVLFINKVLNKIYEIQEGM